MSLFPLFPDGEGAEMPDNEDDDGSILDEEKYSEDEILEDKVRLKDQRRQVEKEAQEYKSKYEKLIEKGQSEAISDDRREELAHQANMIKKKYSAAKQKLQDIRMEIALVASVEAVREIISITGRKSTNIGQMVDNGDISAEEVNEIMHDIRVEHGIRREEMSQAISALDIDMMPEEGQMEQTAEYEMMKEGVDPDIEDEMISDEELGTSDSILDEDSSLGGQL